MHTDLDRAVIESACRQLLTRYATAVDSKDWKKVLTVFAEDAAWLRPGVAPMRGPATILAYFEAMHASRSAVTPLGHLTRHNFTTVNIEAVDQTHATGISYCLVFRYEMYDGTGPAPMSQPEALVEYRNGFEKRAEGWRIVTHEAQHMFRKPDYVQPLSENELAKLGLKT